MVTTTVIDSCHSITRHPEETITVNRKPHTSRPRLRWLATGLTTGLLAAAIAGPGVGVAQAQSDTADQLPTISVSGVGRVKAEPDIANVTIGVTKQGEDAGEAAEKAAKSMESVIAALLDLGIAERDIQTTSLNLSPSYDWDDNPPNIVGWEASNMVNVTVRDIESVGEVVDAATAAGATNMDGISFRVEDPTDAEAAARTAAVADARTKADQLAEAAGVTIVGVQSISESGGQAPEPVFYARAEAAFDTAASTPVLPGEVELSINVFMVYEIE
jgi:uncharacterized protein YggE